MLTRSWYAWLALRRRVSMSAIGSVMVMSGGTFLAAVPLRAYGEGGSCEWSRVCYQDALDTPGSSPRWAISRMQMRHRPNLRYTALGRPHRLHRVYARTANF